MVIQLNYHMLENLVRGLLSYQDPSCGLKLYETIQLAGVQEVIFNSAIETEIFKAFTSASIDHKHDMQTKIARIFTQYFT